MIKKKDLRIGNIVKYNDLFGDFYEIDAIGEEVTIYNPKLKKSYFSVDYGNITGIELTGEILLKCGFENWNKDYYRFLIPKFDYFYLPKHEKTNVKNVNKISYLHELQNFMYYNFNKFELNIKT